MGIEKIHRYKGCAWHLSFGYFQWLDYKLSKLYYEWQAQKDYEEQIRLEEREHS
jgi:hypothetical protein